MNDFFADTKFESLDFLSQAVAPYTGSWIDSYDSIPKQMPLKFEDFVFYGYSSISVSTDRTRQNCLIRHGLTKNVASMLSSNEELFTFDRDNADIIFTNNKFVLSNTPMLLKTKDTIPNDILLNTLRGYFRDNLYVSDFSSATLERMKEVHEVVKAPEDQSLKMNSKRLHAVYHNTIVPAILKIVSEDAWFIRNVDLFDKIATWTKSYILNGHIPSLVNLTKLKIMTHNKAPIYSIKECE